jgi:hypothetical protein
MPMTRPAILMQADQRSPDRHAGDEGARAVDRIDHPDIFAVEPDIAVLLAENAVIGKMLLDQRPDGQLGGPVALGHRIETARFLVRRHRGRSESAAASRPWRHRRGG